MCVYIYIYIYMYVCVYVCVYIYIYIYIYMYRGGCGARPRSLLNQAKPLRATE